MLTLAHITDPHLPPLPSVTWRQIANKRVLGYLSWHRKRKHEHRREVLDALGRDLQGVAPDHICVTGDLTNIGLPEEYQAAARWLETLGMPETVSVIPGNHDFYIRETPKATRALWAPWMTGDGNRPNVGEPVFPFVRRRGRVSLIGVNTGLPTPPFLASGRVGPAQAEALGHTLATEGAAGQVRIILIHHPPQAGAVGWRKSLHDAALVRGVLAQHGAEMVLHGHLHKQLSAEVPGPSSAIPVHGAASASARGVPGHEPAQYHTVTVEVDGADYRLSVASRRYDPVLTCFSAEGTMRAYEGRLQS